MTLPCNYGRDADGVARTQADHHMKCPGCGQWFDMRDLGQVFAHVHGADESHVIVRAPTAIN